MLRTGLWGTNQLELSRQLTGDDGLQIQQYAINHTVERLIYDSFKFLPESHLPLHSLRLRWTVRMDQIERHNQLMNEVIGAQYLSFTKKGLKPILQKGQGIAACYEIPLHRISGDVDWYFEDNGYNQAREILKEKSINFRDTPGFNLDYDWKKVNIEHHKRLFDIQNPFKKII